MMFTIWAGLVLEIDLRKQQIDECLWGQGAVCWDVWAAESKHCNLHEKI